MFKGGRWHKNCLTSLSIDTLGHMERSTLATLTFKKLLFFHAFFHSHELGKTDKSKSSFHRMQNLRPQPQIYWFWIFNTMVRWLTCIFKFVRPVSKLGPFPSQEESTWPLISVFRCFQVQNALKSSNCVESLPEQGDSLRMPQQILWFNEFPHAVSNLIHNDYPWPLIVFRPILITFT